jgi:hypothetical protein
MNVLSHICDLLCCSVTHGLFWIFGCCNAVIRVLYIYIYICEWQNDVYRVGYFNLSTQDANTLAFNWT